MNLQFAHKLSTAARFLGLAQARCFHCLRPFSPDAENFSASTTSPPAGLFDPAASLCPSCRELLAPYRGPRCPSCGLPTSVPSGLSAPMPNELPDPVASGLSASMPNELPDPVARGLSDSISRGLPALVPVGDCETSREECRGSLCGRCLTDPPPWTRAAFYGLYRQSLRHTLLRLKFDGHLYLAPLLGAFLLEAAHCLPGPDALLAVPQYPDHLRHRGYNQAHELAKALHAQTGLALVPRLLSRTRPGPAQVGLNARSRPENVRHSFAASPEVKGLRVWVVDAVMTTGSTLRAAGLALLKAGASSVDVLVVARTPKEDMDFTDNSAP